MKNYTKVEKDMFGNKLYLNDEGQHHRLDGPALEHYNGVKQWCINDKRHRNIDPATEWANGGKRWRFKEKFHRIGGSFYCSHIDYWYIKDKEYIKQDYFNIVWDI